MWKAGRSCPTGHSCEFCVSATTKEGCLRVYYQRDRSDFDHDLPFAPPALRRRQLYTLTFRPGARLARQTIGGRLRTITGTCHPKRVNCASASASGQEGCRTKVIGRRTRVGADRLFVCLQSVGVVANSVPVHVQPIIKGAVADSFLPQECSSHASHPKLDQYPRVVEEYAYRTLEINQYVSTTRVDSSLRCECCTAHIAINGHER